MDSQHPGPDRSWAVLPAFFGVMVSVAFLVLASSRLSWADLHHAVRTVRVFPWVPLAITSYLLGHLVRGLRCRLMLSSDAPLSTRAATHIVVVGYAVNNILPARLGELVRAGMMAERTSVPFAQALTVTLLERLFDASVIVGLLLVTTRVVPTQPWIAQTARTGVWLVALASPLIALLVARPRLLIALASRVGGALGPRLHPPIVRLGYSVAAGLAYLRGPGHALRIGALSVAIWLFESGMFFFLLPAVGLRANLGWAVLAMSTTNLGILVPSSPGFIGPFHYFCMRALGSVGVPGALAFGYAIVVHLSFYIPITLWGLAAISWYGVEVTHTLRMARLARQAPLLLDALGTRAELVGTLRVDEHEAAPTDFMLSLVEALVPLDVVPLATDAQRAVVGDVAAFVQGQVAQLGLTLRVLFLIGLTGFRGYARGRYLRGFCRLPLADRRAVVLAWTYARLPQARQLMQLVRSLALMAFYEAPAVRAALREDERLVGLAARRPG